MGRGHIFRLSIESLLARNVGHCAMSSWSPVSSLGNIHMSLTVTDWEDVPPPALLSGSVGGWPAVMYSTEETLRQLTDKKETSGENFKKSWNIFMLSLHKTIQQECNAANLSNIEYESLLKTKTQI